MKRLKRKKVIWVSVSIFAVIAAYGVVLYLFSHPSAMNRLFYYSDGQDQEVAEFTVDPEEQLDRFEEWAQYPPHSRPLGAEMVDLVRPYDAVALPQPVLVSSPGDCEETERGRRFNCAVPPEDSGIECDLTPERSISTGESQHRILLHCYRPSQFFAEVDLPLTSIETWVSLQRLADQDPAPSTVTYGDDGENGDETAGDYVYTFVVRPRTVDWGWMDFDVRFEVEGIYHFQSASWFSTPHAVADFQTELTDRIQDGHLHVSVPVTIQKAGYYEFDANLQEEGGAGRFVSTSSWKGELRGGLQDITFEFWGKVIHDKNVDGPYLVRDIRGRRNNSDITPAMMQRAVGEGKETLMRLVRGELLPPRDDPEPLYEYLEPLADAYMTAPYDASDFGDEEWVSAGKTRRIRFLSDLITVD